MTRPHSSRRFWLLSLAVIIGAGLLSRLVHTGWIVFDKYLGDALYAAMVYALARLFLPPRASAVASSLAMLGIELFQLTDIPAALISNERLIVRLLARLMGTHFSALDLLAYAAGIGPLFLVDLARPSDPRRHP